MPLMPRARKAFMMPHTVPNSPMNGVALAVVARKPRLRSRSLSCAEAFLRTTRSTASRAGPLQVSPSGGGFRLISRKAAR